MQPRPRRPTSITLAALIAVAAISGCERGRPAPAPVTIALVYCGWEIWIGNDDKLPPEDPSRYPGALHAIQAALAKVELTRALPPGSLGLVVSYAHAVTVRVPLGPIANITPAALGTQNDYYGLHDTDLVLGLVTAVDQLEKAPAGKKILVVLSDGSDINNATARARLTELRRRVGTLGITVSAITYKAGISSDINLIPTLTDHGVTASSADGLRDELVHLLEHLGG